MYTDFTDILYFLHVEPHLDRVGGLEGHDGVAGVDRPDEGVLVLDADDVADGAHVQLGGQPRQQSAREGARPRDNVGELSAEYEDKKEIYQTVNRLRRFLSSSHSIILSFGHLDI